MKFVFFAGILFVTPMFAQKSEHCLSEQQKSFKEGYQDRSDRCEGLYKLKVSGTPLTITGLAQSLHNTAWNNTPRLDVSWQVPPNQPVHLRALSLQQSVSYRMDSLRSPSSGPRFNWPTEILQRVGVSGDEVALAAWYEPGGAGDSSRVYLPLVVGGQPAASPFEIVLYPGVDLNDCSVSLQPDGGGAAIWRDRVLSKKKYAAADPIRVNLPVNLKSGLYRFEAAAHMSTGGSTTVSAMIWIP